MHLSYTSGITCSTTMPIEVFLLESFGKQTLKIVNWCLKEEDGEKKIRHDRCGSQCSCVSLAVFE